MIEVDQEAFRSASNRWEEQAPVSILLDHDEYKKHFLEEYGIAVEYGNTRVVDEQKYTVFLLKWS